MSWNDFGKSMKQSRCRLGKLIVICPVVKNCEISNLFSEIDSGEIIGMCAEKIAISGRIFPVIKAMSSAGPAHRDAFVVRIFRILRIDFSADFAAKAIRLFGIPFEPAAIFETAAAVWAVGMPDSEGFDRNQIAQLLFGERKKVGDLVFKLFGR